MYDGKPIFEVQMELIERAGSKTGDGKVNLALLTDDLRVEREQISERMIILEFLSKQGKQHILKNVGSSIRN